MAAPEDEKTDEYRSVVDFVAEFPAGYPVTVIEMLADNLSMMISERIFSFGGHTGGTLRLAPVKYDEGGDADGQAAEDG